MTCSDRPKGASSGVYVPHDFKPCCLPGEGQCLLVSHKHCVVLGGTWHISTIEHCGQADCDSDVCRVYENEGHENITRSTTQFWRLPLSLVFHTGIIHMVLFAIIQGFVGSDIERLGGWFRLAGIYLISGIGGLLFGSTMRPYDANVGSGGAICGLISVHTIELIQAWPLVNNRGKAVAKVSVLVIIMLTFGMFPGVNQFTNLFGAVLGVLCSFAIMPYVSFTKRHEDIMLGLRIGSITLMIILISVLIYVFYESQPNDIGAFKMINCLAFVKYSCDDDLP